MAILLPFILRYKKEPDAKGNFKSTTLPLLVNPTDITVRKRAQIAETRTLGGTVYQPWPNIPDEVGIKGIMYGSRSVVDFNTLQNIIDKRPDLKEIDLIYKWKTYSGYIKDVTIGAVADKPRQFTYEFTFASKTSFDLPRMMLGQLTGYKTELDYLRNELYGMKQNLVADPITGIVNAAAVAAAFGTSDIARNAFGSVQSILNKNK